MCLTVSYIDIIIGLYLYQYSNGIISDRDIRNVGNKLVEINPVRVARDTCRASSGHLYPHVIDYQLIFSHSISLYV